MPYVAFNMSGRVVRNGWTVLGLLFRSSCPSFSHMDEESNGHVTIRFSIVHFLLVVLQFPRYSIANVRQWLT